MTKHRLTASVMANPIAICLVLGFYSLVPDPNTEKPSKTLEDTTKRDVVLFKFDDSKSTFGFTTEDYGRTVVEGLIYNHNSQIAYARDEEGLLRASMNGGELSAIVDLGDLRDPDTGLSLFWSLQNHEGNLVVRTSYEQSDAHRVVGTVSTPTPGFKEAPIHIAHCYVLALDRVSRAGLGVEKRGSILIKFMITDHVPHRYVRFVWDVLSP